VDRLEVAHLADEDHVGVLAQGALDAGREGRRVRADLALVDDAALVRVQELDRVLDGEDVVVARAVDLPVPVGPVTSTNPRGLWANSCMTAGSARSSIDLISVGMCRNAALTADRCTKALTRKRAVPGTA
jgi:hypothetical protein